MALIPLLAMVRKDLLLFFSDRRSVIVSFVVPIAIASFFGSIFSGPSQNGETAKIAVAIIDQDGSAISKGIVVGMQGDKNFKVTTPTEAEARDAVRVGRLAAAVIVPKGFGDAAGSAFFGEGEKPPLNVIFDPSRGLEKAVVSGVMTQHVMEAVSKEMFGGASGKALIERTLPQVEGSQMAGEQKWAMVNMLRAIQQVNRQKADGKGGSSGGQGITVPYTVHEEAMTSGSNVKYNGYAHSFAGMAIQFLLFAMANLGVEMLLERQRGLWKRLRSAPVSKFTLLAGKVASGSIISLTILLVCFAFSMIVFGVRIQGSTLGFFAIAVACALMASTFGLLVAALGNSPATARGLTSLAVLMMVMLGGAWVPSFVFPAWLQQFTLAVPVRWAIDGLDAMTWRGIGLSGAAGPTLALLAFAVVFSAIAAWRFKWEEA
jgi:ABC-2 type transport system permease protein